MSAAIRDRPLMRQTPSPDRSELPSAVGQATGAIGTIAIFTAGYSKATIDDPTQNHANRSASD